MEDVILMVVPVFVCKLGSNLFQLLHKTVRTGYPEAGFQCRRYCFPMLLPVLPQVRVQAPVIYAARIGNIKHIAEDRFALAGVD